MHDRERGGILTLAGMIEEGLTRHGIAVETDYLFPQPGLGTLRKLRCAAAMARRIAGGGFDALIAYQATASILVGAVGRMQGCGLRIVHQTCTPGATALPVRLADRLAGSLGLYSVNIANSVATRDEFAGYPAAYRRSMILIEHGLDAPAPRSTRAQTRRQFNLPSDKPLLLNIGRLMPQKNQAVLLRALTRLPDMHLAIAGDGTDGGALRALAGELGVAGRLHLLGALPSAAVADLYAAADLFVFPSTWETFGLAAVEAAMAGLPVVATDLAVLREVLRTQAPTAARFVSPHDVDGWVAAIQDGVATRRSPQMLQNWSSEIADKYSRERMIESYVRLLRPVMPPRPSRSAAMERASG